MPKDKNIKKAIRTVLEVILVSIALIFILSMRFNGKRYIPFNADIVELSEDGFVTLSYWGVNGAGNNMLIGYSNLEQQLKALKENGFVTITMQDAVNFLNNKIKLPKKSLLLIFKDSRRETAIFAQPILQKYNFKATFYTHDEKTDGMLTEKDIQVLSKNSYCEIDKNGKITSNFDMIKAFPHWSINHVLMRVNKFRYQDIKFNVTNQNKADKWDILYGAAEFTHDSIILTSPHKEIGIMRLNNSQWYKNLNFKGELSGIDTGGKWIYFRADSEFRNYISVGIKNNILFVYENVVGIPPKNLLHHVLDTDSNSYDINISLNENILSIWVNGEAIHKNIKVTLRHGFIFLQSEWGGRGYSRSAVTDYVYDAIFKNIVITDDSANILFSY